MSRLANTASERFGLAPLCIDESDTNVGRILHIPSFEREYARYWQNPKAVRNGFILKLVLLLSIGTSVYHNADVDMRTSVRQWIHAGQSWLSAPFEKSRLTIDGLQIYCLLLLARQVNGIESDLVSSLPFLASFFCTLSRS